MLQEGGGESSIEACVEPVCDLDYKNNNLVDVGYEDAPYRWESLI